MGGDGDVLEGGGKFVADLFIQSRIHGAGDEHSIPWSISLEEFKPQEGLFQGVGGEL